MCKAALAAVDEVVKIEPNRKNNWIVERKDSKTLLTIFGEVNYKRTYYRSKKTGKYKYLSDEFLGIDIHDSKLTQPERVYKLTWMLYECII